MDGRMWFCIIGSIIATAIGVLWFLIGVCSSKQMRKRMVIAPLHGLLVGVATGFFLIFIDRNITFGVNGLDAVITTILNILRVFSGEDGLMDTREKLVGIPDIYQDLMWTYTAIIHLLVPLLLAGILLSVIKGLIPRLRYRFNRKREVYFFSGLNEKTVSLAEDIEENRSREVLLVFCNNCDEETSNLLEWKSRIEEIGGIFLNKDISTLKLPYNAKTACVRFFLLEDKEENNLRLVLELSEKYKNQQKVTIHVSAMMPEAEDLLDSVDKGTKKIRLRLIHETRTLIYNLMDQVPLFLGAMDGKISVLIIGAGRIGIEALKAACWCGQVTNHRLDIYVVDMDEYAESRFLNKCPGFATYMDDPNIQEKFLIEFHHINVEHREFTEFMQKHPDIGYVICALGDEELNLQIAADIRCNYERIGHKKNAYGKRLPLINTLISNPFLHEVGGKLKNVQNQEYELNPFGNVKNLYTWKLISGTYLDQLAYSIHRIYDDGREEGARERFESSEYNRKASIVSALHCKYKLYSSLGRENEKIASDDNSRIWRNHPTDNMIEAYIRYITALDTVEPDRNKVSRIRIEELAKLEHKRWNMYMLTEGFLPATMDEFRSYYRLVSNHKNMIAKKHPGIVLWDKLDEVSSFVSDTMKKEVNLKEEDRKIVKSIPQILWQNSNSERSAEMRARLLMHKAPPVRHIQFDSSGKAKENFTVLLIGFGVNGQQLLRTLMMNSQFYGSTFSVAVVDDNVEEKRIRFQKQYGGLLSAYHVVFYEMKKLHKTLNHIKNIQLPEVKYMVICKEFDIDNERIFDIFQESNPWESVEPYFMNGAISEEQIYQYASMEKMAMLVNYNYAKMGGQSDSLEKLWEDTDFHSRQSCRASSDFIRSMYHIAGFDIGLERVAEEVFQERVKGELLENLSRTEHLRWNAFHYTMGYSAMSMREVQERACNGIKPYQKDVENKKHACIAEWDELDELSALMSKLTGKQIDYKEADRANVMNMPRTLNG